jgi:proteasome accessory factor C
VWFTPDRARWAREDKRVIEELKDGAVIVEIQAAGHDWLTRAILEEAGDAAVLEPDDARAAVLEAAETLAGMVSR